MPRLTDRLIFIFIENRNSSAWGTDKSPLGQKPTRTKAHWTISHGTKAHCYIWQGGQKPTSLKKKWVEVFYKTVNPDQTAPSG